MLKEGVSIEDLKTLVEQEPDLSRRSFLKKAAAAAGGAAMGSIMPSTAKAGGHDGGLHKRSEIYDRGVLAMIERLKNNAATDYRSAGKSGGRLVKIFADDFFDGNMQKAAQGYDKTMYPRIVTLIQKLPVGMAPLDKLHVAKVQLGVKPDGSHVPVQLVLNSYYPWHDEKAFQSMTGLSPWVNLTHEFEHAMEGFVNQLTKGKYNLSDMAMVELGKIFDLSQVTTTRSQGETGEKWGKDLGEIYAEFKALRTRLGGEVGHEDLEILCENKRLIFNYGIKPQDIKSKEYSINFRHLELLKCPITREAVEASNRFAALDKRISNPEQQPSRYAEQKKNK